MANIERFEGKTGVSFRISVSCGYDSTGKKIRHRMKYKSEPGMTERQIQKAVTRAAADFEQSIEQGYQLDNRQTFEEYARYVLELKERSGLKYRTLERYESLMTRIVPAIGHIKLNELRPQHLNSFYKNLSEEGVRTNEDRAEPKVDLLSLLKSKKLSQAALASMADVAPSTVSSVCRGNKVRLKHAENMATALGKKTSDLFSIEQNKKPLANKTILEYHRLISAVLTQTEKEMLVPYKAATKASPPKQKRAEINYFQPEQIASILDALEKEPIKWSTITHLLIVTGCRRGEIMGLKWDKVDLTNGRIKIDTALLYSVKKGIYEDSTKSSDVRFLNIPPETVSLLKHYRVWQTETRLLNGDRWQDTGYVFTKESGEPMNPESITAWLSPFSERHNLPHINPHAFRHTVASVLISSGTDVVTVSKQLGHANVNTTESFYSHIIEESKAQATECIANVMLRRKKG